MPHAMAENIWHDASNIKSCMHSRTTHAPASVFTLGHRTTPSAALWEPALRAGYTSAATQTLLQQCLAATPPQHGTDTHPCAGYHLHPKVNHAARAGGRFPCYSNTASWVESSIHHTCRCTWRNAFHHLIFLFKPHWFNFFRTIFFFLSLFHSSLQPVSRRNDGGESSDHRMSALTHRVCPYNLCEPVS